MKVVTRFLRMVFRDFTSYGSVGWHWRFGGTRWCVYLGVCPSSGNWRWRQHVRNTCPL